MSDNIEDILGTVWFVMRLIAFFSGLWLVFTGFGEIGTLGSLQLLQAMSTGSMASIKIVVGVIFVILAIVPSAIKAVIETRL
jgi:hypothetical protein